MAERELSIREARMQFAEVVSAAAEQGEVVYLTRHGGRVAAVVPLELAAAVPAAGSYAHDAWNRLVRARAEQAEAEAEYWRALEDARGQTEGSATTARRPGLVVVPSEGSRTRINAGGPAHTDAEQSASAQRRGCPHQPPCPDFSSSNREAAHVVAAHPEQGWSLLCNGVIVFDDAGVISSDDLSQIVQ